MVFHPILAFWTPFGFAAQTASGVVVYFFSIWSGSIFFMNQNIIARVAFCPGENLRVMFPDLSVVSFGSIIHFEYALIMRAFCQPTAPSVAIFVFAYDDHSWRRGSHSARIIIPSASIFVMASRGLNTLLFFEIILLSVAISIAGQIHVLCGSVVTSEK